MRLSSDRLKIFSGGLLVAIEGCKPPSCRELLDSHVTRIQFTRGSSFMTAEIKRGLWPALIARAQAITERLEADEADSRGRLSFMAYHPRRLLEMIKSGRKLTAAEYEALAEAWYYKFGELLPTGDASDREPPPPKPQLPPPNYIVAPKLAAKIMGVSLSYLQRAEKDGRLPKRVRMSTRRVGYFIRDIEAWQDRIEHEALLRAGRTS